MGVLSSVYCLLSDQALRDVMKQPNDQNYDD